MATLPDFNNAISYDTVPAFGVGATSIGGPLFVLNDDSETATDDPNDPNNMDDTSVRPVLVPNMGLYLEMYHIYNKTTDPSVTALQVRVFGLTPAPATGDRRKWPYDDNTAIYDLNPSEMWVPLQDPDNTSVSYIEFNNTHAMDVVQGSFNTRVSMRRKVYVAGCTKIMVTVKQVAGNLASGATGLVAGRFVG